MLSAQQFMVLTASLLWSVGCSSADSESPVDDSSDPFLAAYVGAYEASAVQVTDNACNLELTDDNAPQVGDSFVVTISDDGTRIIMNECKQPNETNCIDHFPDWWVRVDDHVENKHVDNLYEGNNDASSQDCKLTAYSTWTAKVADPGLAIKLSIVMSPEGNGCGEFEAKIDGCKGVVSTTATKL